MTLGVTCHLEPYCTTGKVCLILLLAILSIMLFILELYYWQTNQLSMLDLDIKGQIKNGSESRLRVRSFKGLPDKQAPATRCSARERARRIAFILQKKIRRTAILSKVSDKTIRTNYSLLIPQEVFASSKRLRFAFVYIEFCFSTRPSSRPFPCSTQFHRFLSLSYPSIFAWHLVHPWIRLLQCHRLFPSS